MQRRSLIIAGIILLALSQIIFGLTFYPVISQEISYRIQTVKGTAPYREPDSSEAAQYGSFKIFIPKIDVKSEVLPNIDPFNKNQYLEALKKGVAMTSGSAMPGKKGNVFIFAHSTDSPLNIKNYNAVFYLANKLTAGDSIYLAFGGKYYKYVVEDKKIVAPDQIQYLSSTEKSPTLTLMTCWPPGTTLKRLLINGKLAI